MNVNLLIDNIVRQTTVLVAQLATAAGVRAPLAHVANQVFVDLVRELKGQGLGNKVIADMFGLTLRTYHDRVRRTSESVTERGTSLWEAVLQYVRGRPTVTRGELLRRFAADDEASLRGVLTDLVDSGLLFKSGRVDTTTYRAASQDETAAMLANDPEQRLENLLWVWLHRRGQASFDEVAAELAVPVHTARKAVDTLIGQGRVKVDAARGSLTTDHCVIPYGDECGWEAALFDHYQAVVTAIGSKVAQGKRSSRADEATGGSTYHFDMYPGHPQEHQVLGLLRSVREQATALRERAERHPVPAHEEGYRVMFYVGQHAVGHTAAGDEEMNEGAGL